MPVEVLHYTVEVGLFTQRLNPLLVAGERSRVQLWRQRLPAAPDFWSPSQVCDSVARLVAVTVR